MGAEQSRDKWSPEGDLKLLLEDSNDQENDQSISSLGHRSREKVSTAIKRSLRFAQKPAKCICTKYNKINNTSDQLCLQQLFPEKIWKMILKHSKNSTDLQNLSNASPFFRNILLPRRIEFLFPKVFQVLVHQYEQNPSECFDMIKYQELEQPKHRPEYLRPSDILWDFPGNLRLVCRAWNKAVQQYHGQLNEWQLKLKTDRKVRRRRIPMNHLIDITSHSWFTQHFREETRNPFLHKSLTFANICADRELSGLQQAYEREAQMILRKFGCYLNYINISMENGSSSVSCSTEFFNYLLMNKSINLLPNIKVLKLEHKFEHENQVFIKELDKSSRTRKPFFCNFPNLQFLSVHNLSASIFNGLIEQNHTTISQLEIESCMYPDQYNYFHGKLPNLKSLSIDLYSEAGIQNLEQYGGTWDLTKFHCIRRGLNYIKLSRILRMVCNNWSATLKDFYLELQNIDSEEEMWDLSKSFEMHLPQLERIAIKLSSGWCSLDFLLPLKKLKYIEIDSDATKPWNKYSKEHGNLFGRRQKIRFLGYEKTMLKSNVWKLFPKLESFVVQGNVFNRERK